MLFISPSSLAEKSFSGGEIKKKKRVNTSVRDENKNTGVRGKHSTWCANTVVHRLQDALQMSPVCVCVGMNRFSLYVGDKAGRAQRDKLQLPVSTNIELFGVFPKISALSHTATSLQSRSEGDGRSESSDDF